MDKMTNFGDRIIVLIDMDCFFCQVETKLQPEYKGKPLAVVQYNQWKLGGIIAVNYEAREFGVTRHMRGDEAKEKCPDIVLATVPCLRGKADTSRYRAAGRCVIEVLKSHCSKIERASVDEAYLDITHLVDERMLNQPSITKDIDKRLTNTYIVGYSEVGVNDDEQRKSGIREWLQNSEEINDNQAQRLAVAGLIVEEIRADIYAKTEYRCSAGISYNKILAKLSCGLHKPNRQTILPSLAVPSLFSTLPVKKVRNLGGKFGDIVIESLKCNVMADLLQYSLQYLQNRFDEKTGLWLYNIARGIDNEPVTTRLVSKSIGACKKFPGKQSLTTTETLKHWLGELAAEICERLEQDTEENERRATLLTVSYQYYQNNSIISQSKSIPMSSYKREKMQSQSFGLISKIQHPIVFLGLSAGKFVKAKGSENFINFFKCEQSENASKYVHEKTSICEIKNENVNKLDETCEIKENNIFTSKVSNEPIRNKKVHSFFKFINNIPTPKLDKQTDNLKKNIENAEKLKKSFFVNAFQNSHLKNNDSANSVDYLNTIENKEKSSELESEHSTKESMGNEEDNVVVRLQDIFPDLDNIDTEVLSCLPLQLQNEAALFMKNKKTDKISSTIGTPKGRKSKVHKQNKNKGKSIKSFCIKTECISESDTNFLKCEQCGQLIAKEKINEHKDYHVAKGLQSVINNLEACKEFNNKRKNNSFESSSTKRLANDN